MILVDIYRNMQIVRLFKVMSSAELESPFELCPELDEAFLDELSFMILKVVEMTMQNLNSNFDDNYTRETCIYGRVRQLFLQLARDASKPWLTVKSKTMDYVPSICNIPVRVFRDDPLNPKKKKVFFKNDCEQSQLALLLDDFDTQLASQITWRLFIQAPESNLENGELEDLEDDFRVVLVGFSAMTGEIRSMWQSKSASRAVPYAIDAELPEANILERKPVKSKEVDTGLANENGKQV